MLGTHDDAEIQAPGDHENTDERKSHSNLVGDDLGGGAHGA